MPRDTIHFLLGDAPVAVAGTAPTTTVLEWLRARGLPGTKEGCAEGDCGACTVVVAEPADGGASGLRHRPVNACLLFLPALDGRQLLTVEHLADGPGPGATLHPVQQAMVDAHASQCGFCTPGFVMSLFALHQGAASGVDRAQASEALAGNLCRCTGYRPILDAALAACATPPDRQREAAVAAALRNLPQDTLEATVGSQRLAAPRSLADAVALRAARPDAILLAGGTDLGLWVTKELRPMPDIISLDRVAELAQISCDATTIRIGAGVTYEDALPILAGEYDSLGAMMRRLGSRQIRHRGTIGGNLGTASPIGDMAPALIALDAKVILASASGERVVPIDEFFAGYRRTVLRPDELIARIDVPRATADATLHVWKISKRAEEDISAVCAAFRLRLEDGRVSGLRAGFGGVAATPLRAVALERAVEGRSWDAPTLQSGMAALDAAITPIDDMRASARYRRLVARNLLRRLWLQTAQSAAAAA